MWTFVLLALAQQPTALPDSVKINGVFTMPTDDGRGSYDSVTVRLMGATNPPAPTKSYTGSQIGAAGAQMMYSFHVETIAPSAGGSITLDIFAEAFVWRRGSVSRVVSNSVSVVIVDTPPPGVLNHVIAIP